MKFLFYTIIVCSNIVFSTHAMTEKNGGNPHKTEIYKQLADTTMEGTIASGAKIAIGACSLIALAKLRGYNLRNFLSCKCVNSSSLIARPLATEKFLLASPAIWSIGTGFHDFYTTSIKAQHLKKFTPK